MTTSTGLTVDRFPEHLDNIEKYQKANIATDFDYQNNSLIYQLNAAVANEADSVSKLVEVSFDSLDLSKAEGAWSDSLGLLRGVLRLPAAASFTNQQQVVGLPSVTVPAGSLWGSSAVLHRAVNPEALTLSENSSYGSVYEISESASNSTAGTVYGISVNGASYTFTTVSGAESAEFIMQQINDDILADSDRTFLSTITSPRVLSIVPNEGTLTANSLHTLISATEVTNFTRIELTETGPISVSMEVMDTLVTPVAGIVSVINTEDFIVGRDLESDEDFRGRIAAGPTGDCTGTIDTVEAALLTNVVGVTLAKVIENVEDYPNTGVPILPAVGSDTTFTGFPEGIPFGGYEVLVEGGDDGEVASEVWRTKSAGTPIVGNTQVLHTDSSNIIRDVYFTRPTAVNLAFKVTYTLYDEEEFPSNGISLIRDTVLAVTEALQLDEDVIPSRYFGPIYSAVSGIDSLVVEVQVLVNAGDSPDGGSWQTTKLAIGTSEFGSTILGDITVSGV